MRHRKTGISDYTIVEPEAIRYLLKLLRPYVRLKKKHVELGLNILEKLDQSKTAHDFLEACCMVDCFEELNYSKKRTIHADNVKDFLERHNYFTPVETDPKKEYVGTCK